MGFGIVVDGTTRESMGLLGAEVLFLALTAIRSFVEFARGVLQHAAVMRPEPFEREQSR